MRRDDDEWCYKITAHTHSANLTLTVPAPFLAGHCPLAFDFRCWNKAWALRRFIQTADSGGNRLCLIINYPASSNNRVPSSCIRFVFGSFKFAAHLIRGSSSRKLQTNLDKLFVCFYRNYESFHYIPHTHRQSVASDLEVSHAKHLKDSTSDLRASFLTPRILVSFPISEQTLDLVSVLPETYYKGLQPLLFWELLRILPNRTDCRFWIFCCPWSFCLVVLFRVIYKITANSCSISGNKQQ